jgi:uncharacterized protein YecT (DUF1311 family)
MAGMIVSRLAVVMALVVAPQAALAAGFEYRGQCPKPMNIFDTEAYFCETMGRKDLGERVEKAYQAQVAKLHTMYDKPDDAEKLKHRLDVLEASQKGWETYAANECASEGYMAWGGSLEPELVGDCTERLAGARIKELEMLLDGLDN